MDEANEKCINYIKEHKLDLLVWLVYVVLLCFVSYYHEPWHDEGQAWLIARDDSIWQLITVTTHLEGHPPLWHLALMPLAKLGVPFLFGLKAVNIFFCALAMVMLIFKSPLPWYLRLTLPFTYFSFYQYGVVNRVYSLLMFAMMLVAYYYPQRRQKPYKLALSLALAAGSQAYGMMFACGVALVWVVEVSRRERFGFDRISHLWSDVKEMRALSLLLVLSFLWGLCILPFPDTMFASSGAKTGFKENLFYMFALVPGQFLLSNDLQSNSTANIMEFFHANLQNYLDMIPNTGIYGVLLVMKLFISNSYGIILNLGMGYICWRSKILVLFLCPLVMMNLLGALVFWNIYHAGVWVCFYVFILWQLCVGHDKLLMVKNELKTKFTYLGEYIFAKWGLVLCGIAILATNYYWSWTASRNNYLYDTDPSAQIAAFIKENDLSSRKIWLTPRYVVNDKENISFIKMGSYSINCYFSHNILQNLNGGNSRHAYLDYRLLPKEKYIKQVKKFGQPDFIIGLDQHLDYIFTNPTVYVPIKAFHCSVVWKNDISFPYVYMYMREDLLSEFPQFKVIKVLHEDKTDELS